MGENSGTQIQDLMNDINSNKLSSEENSMVDSIINDLNTGGSKQQPSSSSSQQKMPQITDEEREMLMKQQEHEQRMMMEQQMRHQQQMHEQRMMAQKQHDEQQELMERQKKEQELKDSPVEKLKEILFQAKDAIVVMVLVIMFNLEPISEIIKFKSVPFFYNIETDKVEITGIILKSFIIASIFFVLQYFAK